MILQGKPCGKVSRRQLRSPKLMLGTFFSSKNKFEIF